MPHQTSPHEPTPTSAPGPADAQRRRHRTGDTPRFEYRTVTFTRDTPRDEARRLLTEHAEYGRWELARSAIYLGGEHKVVLRRRYVEVRVSV